MVTAIKKIYTNSSSVTFDCNGVAIIGMVSFELYPESWMGLFYILIHCIMKMEKSSHEMNKKI